MANENPTTPTYRNQLNETDKAWQSAFTTAMLLSSQELNPDRPMHELPEYLTTGHPELTDAYNRLCEAKTAYRNALLKVCNEAGRILSVSNVEEFEDPMDLVDVLSSKLN